jgi:hypothetical protein
VAEQLQNEPLIDRNFFDEKLAWREPCLMAHEIITQVGENRMGDFRQDAPMVGDARWKGPDNRYELQEQLRDDGYAQYYLSIIHQFQSVPDVIIAFNSRELGLSTYTPSDENWANGEEVPFFKEYISVLLKHLATAPFDRNTYRQNRNNQTKFWRYLGAQSLQSSEAATILLDEMRAISPEQRTPAALNNILEAAHAYGTPKIADRPTLALALYYALNKGGVTQSDDTANQHRPSRNQNET